MSLQALEYNREKAVEYAHQWSYYRNPRYYNFDEIGGDCTNFASQCLYAGCGVMNYTRPNGWYYSGLGDRAPAWSSVIYLYQFLTQNQSAGPYGKDVPIQDVQPGDLAQLVTTGETYHHTPVVVHTGDHPTLDNILVAAHSSNADNRPLSSYAIKKVRFIHILGARR